MTLLRSKTKPKQLQNNIEKIQKTGLFDLKMLEMTNLEGQDLIENFDFRSYFSIFRAKNTLKVGFLRPNMMPKYFQKNSKTTFN